MNKMDYEPIIVTKNAEGKIILSEEELIKIVKQAYSKGVTDGVVSGRVTQKSPIMPSNPYPIETPINPVQPISPIIWSGVECLHGLQEIVMIKDLENADRQTTRIN